MDWAPLSTSWSRRSSSSSSISRSSQIVMQQVAPFGSPGTSAADSARTRSRPESRRLRSPTASPPEERASWYSPPRDNSADPIIDQPVPSYPHASTSWSGPAPAWVRRTISRSPSPSRSTVCAFTVMPGRTWVESSTAATAAGLSPAPTTTMATTIAPRLSCPPEPTMPELHRAQAEEVASDHHALDLAGSLTDLGQLRVAQVALDAVLGDVAVPAVDL